MRKLKMLIVLVFTTIGMQTIAAQDTEAQKKIDALEKQIELIKTQEKNALKVDIEAINKRLDKKEISLEEAKSLKAEAAKNRALNIENKVAIINNKIALLKRNGNEDLTYSATDSTQQKVQFGLELNDKPIFVVKSADENRVRYDRRTYSEFVWAIGLNNTLIDNESLDDSPYKIGGSRFFEMGFVWQTRVFKNTNFMRLNYGFSFQFNGLKPTNNQYFEENNGQTELQEFAYDLKKSKLRVDNLVFPMHLEFGSSKKREIKNGFRYSIRKQFRLGIGAYGGFNIGTRQKLKYSRDGENVKDKLKRGYNVSDLIYGLSAYTGIGGTLLYVKYDLNPLFKDALVEQHNVSLGLRFDLD